MKRMLSALALAMTCAGQQKSVLTPSGTQSDRIAVLWWGFFWLLATIFPLQRRRSAEKNSRAAPGVVVNPTVSPARPRPWRGCEDGLQHGWH